MGDRAESYRARAEEMRTMAEGKDAEARAIMMSLAENWDRMATQAERPHDRSSDKPE